MNSSPRVSQVLHLAITLQHPPVTIGFRTSADRWPPHTTVMQSFHVEADVDVVVALVQRRAEHASPIDAVAGHIEGFGPNRDIRVTVLTNAEPIVELHEALLGDLQALPGFAPDVPEWAGPGFRPHVTAGSWGELSPGERMVFDRIALVDLGASDSLHVVGLADLRGTRDTARV